MRLGTVSEWRPITLKEPEASRHRMKDNPAAHAAATSCRVGAPPALQMSPVTAGTGARGGGSQEAPGRGSCSRASASPEEGAGRAEGAGGPRQLEEPTFPGTETMEVFYEAPPFTLPARLSDPRSHAPQEVSPGDVTWDSQRTEGGRAPGH